MSERDYEKKTIRHIAGTAGRDPERKPGYENSTFVTFSVAVTRDYGTPEEPAPPRWYGVNVNKESLQDAVMAHVKKGSRVVAEGIPYTTKGDDGRTFYNFRAFRIGLVDYLGLTGSAQPDPDFEDDEDDEEDL